MATVSRDTRLDNRVIDLRTPANQAIFKVQAAVSRVGTPTLSSHTSFSTVLSEFRSAPSPRFLFGHSDNV